MKAVTVLVLGDLGRSPRMQYHCLSLAKQGFLVNFVGLSGQPCRDEVIHNNSIKIRTIPTAPQLPLPALLYLFFKTCYLLIGLLYVLLLQVEKMDYLLVQTPPAVPTLFVAHAVCWLRGCKLVIDWHNLGYTLIALTRKSTSITAIYKWMELNSGRGAFHNFCVSSSMQQFLAKRGIRATVLYDKPPQFFKPSSREEQQRIFSQLEPELKDYAILKASENSISEVLTQRKNVMIGVSSTSWTADEDFTIVLDALVLLEEKLNERQQQNPKKSIRKLLLFITGKGELQQEYLKKLRARNFKHIAVHTLWLAPLDYPVLLGSCDFGVCVHGSSSKLDLPMKVVDMFGSGLPVCALDYLCLKELVKHNQNGIVFQNKEQLADSLFEFLTCTVSDGRLTRLQQEVIREYCNSNRNRWDENWNRVTRTVFI